MTKEELAAAEAARAAALLNQSNKASAVLSAAQQVANAMSSQVAAGVPSSMVGGQGGVAQGAARAAAFAAQLNQQHLQEQQVGFNLLIRKVFISHEIFRTVIKVKFFVMGSGVFPARMCALVCIATGINQLKPFRGNCACFEV